jgi:lipopolysaccharide export system ATP-binding protein
MEKSILKAENISKTFGSRKVVKGVSFEVSTGEVVGLLGPNGAGKTTSFYMLVGLLSPDSGNVMIDEKEITKLPMHKRASLGISYLPQNSSVFKRMSVAQNLLAVMEVVKIPKSDRSGLLEDLLNKFHITHIRETLGAALSGGERRRVEIARSLIIQPNFLLLDEPFAGVDPVTVQEIQQIITNLRNEGLGVLITDHNVRETLGACDRVYVLSQGSIIANGDPMGVAENKLVKEIYLGDNFRL